MLTSWKRNKSARPTRQPKSRASIFLTLEQLETRVLPAWTAIGPAPQLDGQQDLNGAWSQNVTERITALAVGEDNAGHPALFLGVAGGVWRSTDFVNGNGTANNNPTWTLLVDFAGLPALGPKAREPIFLGKSLLSPSGNR
jgi:hypothetical protein